MQNSLPKIYSYVDSFNLSDLSNLSNNINLIYRNYSKPNDIETIRKLKNFCRETRRKFFISNNIKLALNLKLDGIYIPSFNKKINYCDFNNKRPNFEIIGSAHNFKEIVCKEKQGCSEIFISPIFKNNKSNKYLGICKFSLLTYQIKKKTIALGGINENNYKQLRSLNISGFACISWAKKNGPKNISSRLKFK